MRVLQGQDVDVLEPFPTKALPLAVGWLHCYKSIVTADDGPQSAEDMLNVIAQQFAMPNFRSFAVVDKNNLTNQKSDSPLVGLGYFQRISPENGYIHVVSSRKAWGDKIAQPGLVDQAGHIVINDLFKTEPELLRISAMMLSNNRTAIELAKRLGFQREATMRNMLRVNKQPANLVHMALMRGEEVQYV